jgi:hypothetical protein
MDHDTRLFLNTLLILLVALLQFLLRKRPQSKRVRELEERLEETEERLEEIMRQLAGLRG